MPNFLTVQEVADILRVSYDSALAFIKASGVDYLQIGRQYRVSAEKLHAFLQRKGHIVVGLR